MNLERLHEKCAVVGVANSGEFESTPEIAIEALFALQHRGTEASGVVTSDVDGNLLHKRGLGLVSNIYDEIDVASLENPLAVGHNRYATSGDDKKHKQPCIDTPLGFSFAHNGNIPDTTLMDEYLESQGIRLEPFNDSEKMSLILAQEIRLGSSLPESIEKVHHLFTGAYSCVASHDGCVVAFRDPKGIRPLDFGKTNGSGYIAASETCAIEIVDGTPEFTINPGEMVIFNEHGFERKQFQSPDPHLDIFEFVYFARPDSVIEGQSVDHVRRNLGRNLARIHPPIADDASNVLVVGIPDTSIPASEAYAETLGLQESTAVIKNRYIGRTFMQPTQGDRKRQLRRKHSMIPELIHGRDVIFIDDSIVRLNTMPRLVKLAKELGANTVSVLVASSPVRFPDFYGIDTPSQSELAAANMTIEEMQRDINCDYLGFLSVSAMVAATGIPGHQLNLAAFTGEYPIDIGRKKAQIRAPKSTEYMD